MATTPHVDPPKPDDKAKPPDDKPKHATLKGEDALSLFRNGHRIAKEGDPPEKWLSMSRTNDGATVCQTPLSDELLETIKSGSYYLIDHQG